MSPSAGVNQGGEAMLPAYIRADGTVRLTFGVVGERTKLVERADGGGYLVRTPRHRDPLGREVCEAVLINTGGGMAGGDRLMLTAEARPGAWALVTTQAAEKIYRSQGPASMVDVDLLLGPASRLDWLPQETILFSGSRLRRKLTCELGADAAVTIAETVIFGRIAMREVLDAGSFNDRWRIRRDGKLIFAEDVDLSATPARLLARKASGDGARAMATILHIAPKVELRIDGAREMLAQGSTESGASAWNGMLLMRFMSRDARTLRADVVRAVEWLRGEAAPRSW